MYSGSNTVCARVCVYYVDFVYDGDGILMRVVVDSNALNESAVKCRDFFEGENGEKITKIRAYPHKKKAKEERLLLLRIVVLRVRARDKRRSKRNEPETSDYYY